MAEAKRLNMAAVDQAIQSNNTDQLQIEGKTFTECRIQPRTLGYSRYVLIRTNLISIVFHIRWAAAPKPANQGYGRSSG